MPATSSTTKNCNCMRSPSNSFPGLRQGILRRFLFSLGVGRKWAEQALQESEQQLARVIASAMDAIITVNDEHRIVLFNAAAERVFRCPAGKALGQPLDRFIPPRFRAAHGEYMKRFAGTGLTTRTMDGPTPLRALRADGEEFPMEASISVADAGGKKLFTVILRDVTQRVTQAEQLAKQAKELARSNHDLEEFAYVASHDLQEPLRMVAAYTQLLAERYHGQLDPSADRYIGYAVEGAQRMQTLIQDLLAFSRAGRNGHERKLADCKEVIEEALGNLRAAVLESGAEVTCGQLPAIFADRSQLVQLFQNLIGNAIKFHGSRPPAIAVSSERQNGEWKFAVADNGIGIAPEHKSAVFDIFHRLHTRTEYPGNGVGLAICKKIVEQHGGRIWVDSVPGRGSTFQFTFPA